MKIIKHNIINLISILQNLIYLTDIQRKKTKNKIHNK